MRPLPLVLTILASNLVGVVLGANLFQPAHADVPPPVSSPSCTQVLNTTPAASNAKWEAWLREQLAAGRTHFVSHPAGVCAW